MKKPPHTVHADPDVAVTIEEQAFGAQNPVTVQEDETGEPDRELRPRHRLRGANDRAAHAMCPSLHGERQR
jgi:hypothetical protein